MEKQKVYETHWEKDSNRLIIEDLPSMFIKGSNRPVCGSVGLLQNPLSIDANEYGLYLTTRTNSVDGTINVKFSPIFDEEGNQVFISGDEKVYETPFAFGDSIVIGYSYLIFN